MADQCQAQSRAQRIVGAITMIFGLIINGGPMWVKGILCKSATSRPTAIRSTVGEMKDFFLGKINTSESGLHCYRLNVFNFCDPRS